MRTIPTLLCDFYKLSHRVQYPVGTECVYSTWTARGSRMEGVKEVVAFGMQGFIQEYLVDYFDENFFSLPKHHMVEEYVRFIKSTLKDPKPDTKHLEDLHDLGFLPLKIRAVKEGTRVPLRVPMMTIQSTNSKFAWLTNYLETLISCELWQPMTSATIADLYRQTMDKWAVKTVGLADARVAVPFLGHDFSMRGMAGVSAAAKSGAGHLLSFVGTDTCPAITYLEDYYDGDIENNLVGTSIPATEHSVMCANGRDELACYKRFVTDIYPNGFVSIVSDTWDLWKVLSEVIAPLKTEILGREGRVVIRPDSGDPVLIVCGNPDGKTESERKGVIELLWDIFGGTTSEQGYKVLDSHIGCIYGDAITLARCEEISKRLAAKGFASVNVVYGIGSYTYQYVTRDTFNFAMKSTLVTVNGKEIQIFKDPVTDSGMKKSAKGRVRVHTTNGVIAMVDELFLADDHPEDLLHTVFENGELSSVQSLKEIRERLAATRLQG